MRVKVSRGNQGYRCRRPKVEDFDLGVHRSRVRHAGEWKTAISLALIGRDLTTYANGHEHSVQEVISLDLTDDQAHELKVTLDRILAAPYPGMVTHG